MRQTFRKFRAATFDEAYAEMAAEMGPDALVVNTAEVKETGLRGLFGKTAIELTASRATRSPETAERSARRPSLAEKKYLSHSEPKGHEEPMNDTLAYFQQLVSDAQARIRAANAGANAGANAHGNTATNTVAAPAVVDDWEPLRQAVAARANASANAPAPGRAAGPEVPGTSSVLIKAADAARAVEQQAKTATVVPFPRPSEAGGDLGMLQEEIVEMRRMLEVLIAEAPPTGMPQDFAPRYRELIETGMCRKLAASLVGGIVRHCDLRVLQSNPRVLTEKLKFEIQRLVSVTHGLRLGEGGRKVVALVGATGVGKTTSLAKLAAMYALQERARVALITTDTYRVAAPEQLRVYANIVGLPLLVANDTEELRAALEEFGDYDLVLVDTAGGSPFNTEQTEELRGMLAAAKPDETLLVLNANTHLEEMRNAVTGFKPLKPTSVMFTKLDETRRYGAMVSLAAETGLPMGYFSNGQNVPDDIEVASPSKLAKLLLQPGGDRRGSSK